MGRLRLYSRSTGGCQYDSEHDMTDSSVNERAESGGRGGLLFYYDPSGELWCHVDIVRDIPERLLAQYESDSQDIITEFTRTLESEVDSQGWEIPDREDSKHEAYRSLPPSPPADPPADTVEDIRRFGKSGNDLDEIVFGAPDYRSSMALMAYLRDAFDDTRSILVSTDRSVEGFDPDIRIEFRPDLDSVGPIGETAAWLNEQRFEEDREQAASLASSLHEIRVERGLDLSRLTSELRGRSLRNTDATVITASELDSRKQRANGQALRRLSVLFAVVGLAAVLFLRHGPLLGAILEPIPLPILPSTVASRLPWTLSPPSVPTGAVLGSGVGAFMLGVGLLWTILPTPSRADDSQPDATEETQPAESLPETFHTKAEELVETLGDLRQSEYIEDAEEYRETAAEILETGQAGSARLHVFAPGEPEKRARRARLRGAALAFLLAAVLTAAVWLLVTLVVDYRQPVTTVAWYLGIATFLLAVLGLVVTAVAGSGRPQPDTQHPATEEDEGSPAQPDRTASTSADHSGANRSTAPQPERGANDTGPSQQTNVSQHAFESDVSGGRDQLQTGFFSRGQLIVLVTAGLLGLVVIAGIALFFYLGPSL